MKFLFRSIAGPSRALLRALGRHQFSDSAGVKAKRNYAENVSEYNTVLTSLVTKRWPFLLRDVYDDMMVDGVQPTGDIFVALIMGTMRGARLQDAFFFRDEMRAMGLVPEVALYNFLISTCGKCKNSILAIQIVEEMKRYNVKPNGQTYVCLLNACAAAGRLDQALAIVHDMTAAGFELNKFCYAGLMVAHINKMPRADDVAARIIELAEQSKGWSSLEASGNTGNAMLGASEEELYNLPTAEFVHRPFFLYRQFTIYHVAFHACADLRNVDAIETLLEMLKKDGKTPDTFITMQTMRCYLHAADIDRAVQIFEDYLNEGKPPVMELYAALVEGAMVGHTPRGRQLAQETSVNMTSRKFFLNNKVGSDLLLAAAGEKARDAVPSHAAVEAYYNGLIKRGGNTLSNASHG